MASKQAKSSIYLVHAWCDADGVDKTVGDWHWWGWYSTWSVAEQQATRVVNERWVARDGTCHGRFEIFHVEGSENGK